MLEQSQRLYKELVQSIKECEETENSIINKLECCFHKAVNIWSRLSAALMVYEFRSPEEEIDFFKRLKPWFTSEIEYYSLLYTAELFKPAACPNEIKKFWMKELNRFEVFVIHHTDFYTYYKSGQTCLDKSWFVRLDPFERTASSYDHFVASLQALERYCAYVKIRLSLFDKD